LGIGVKETPQADCRRQQHQPECLVAPVDSRLFRPPRLLGYLLVMRLDAGLHHEGSS